MNKVLLSLELEGLPPTVNHLYRSTKGGRRYKTADSKQYQEYASANIMSEWTGKPAYSGAVDLRITFETDDRRRWDIDNRIKALQDCLRAAHVLVDDAQVESLTVRRIYGYRKATLLEVREH